MNSKLSHWCNGFLEIGWLAAIISIPLFFNIHSDRVFEPDKLTLLRSIALLMSAAWLVKFIDERGWQRLRWLGWQDEESVWQRPFVLPVFLLVIVYLLSNLFSITPQVSWAGSYQRLQGTYTTLSYIVIFALLVSTMRTKEQIQRVATAVILASIPISFYGILQRFELDPLPWGGDTQRRIAGHMGNAIFIAAYLIMALPLTLARIIDAFTNILEDEELSAADVIRASIYIFATALQLAAIYWSSSRGPWLGLAVALFAFMLILLVSLRNAETSGQKLSLADVAKVLALLLGGLLLSFFAINLLLDQVRAAGMLQSLSSSLAAFVAFAAAVGMVTLLILVLMAIRRGWRWLWLSWLLLAFLVAAGLGAFNFAEPLNEQFGQTPLLGRVTATLVAWKDEPSLGRLGRLLESDRATGRVRVLIWEGALDLIGIHDPLQFPDGSQDRFNFLRPLLGYGPESMYVAYNRFYPPLLATVEARNASPDRSHNETFDALVITGWAGFLVWQALYLSVFYYGFKWLGVVRRQRDRNLLIALWIGGAVVTTAVIVPLMGLPFFGVAVPFGSIIGLVLYLTYYAIFVPAQTDSAAQEPFQMERLLLIGLVTAVLAHYVEIHFGIAIAATRLHFFVYVGLMFVMGYVLPRLKEEKETVVATPVPAKITAKTRRKRMPSSLEGSSQDVWGPALLHGLILLFLVGILSFQYITYSLTPGKTITSPADLSPVEIFYQSLFLNARQDFADSPFVFMMIVLTWALGVLVSLSELVKCGELTFTAVATSAWPANRRQTSLLLLGVSTAASLAGVIYSYTAAIPVTASGTLGRALLLGWLVLSAVGAVALYQGWKNGRFMTAIIAVIGLLFTIPLLVAGAIWQAFLLAAFTVALLYSLWDRHWRQSIMPALVMGITSISIGLFLGFLQANQLKGSITPTAPRQFTTVQELRVFEAGLVNGFLTLFYAFVIVVLIAGAFVLARHTASRLRTYGSTPAFIALVFIFALTLYGIVQTNLRVVQADMVFKRGKPFESQAAQAQRGSEQAIAAWDSTIAIYEYALELAPREDFYYLFLGRAYLERSTIEPDLLKQRQLFEQAEARLLRAQDINPLNTDHTANLARLNTRLVQLAADETEREARLQIAESYYRTALTLSPQNSVIRNELGVLVLELKGSCDEALTVYREAVAIDPYFATAYYALADGLVSCADPDTVTGGGNRSANYTEAAEALRAGLALDEQNARAWLQLAQVEQELGQYTEAILAYESALANDTRTQLPAWNVNYLIAEAYQALGETEQAVQTAQLALRQAPAQAVPQVQQLLLTLGVDASELPATQSTPESTPEGAREGERPLASLPPAQRNNYYNAPPPLVIDLSKSYEAIIQTERGDIRLRLFDDAAPLTVNNFVFLAGQGFYDETTFHRVLPDFMAQAGDPTGSGAGGPGYQFADEVNNGLFFDRRGLLAMANAGPGTNGSQFFITFAPTPWLDNRHTIFGEVIAGDEVLSDLTLRDPMANPDYLGDRILRIDIVEITQ